MPDQRHVEAALLVDGMVLHLGLEALEQPWTVAIGAMGLEQLVGDATLRVVVGAQGFE